MSASKFLSSKPVPSTSVKFLELSLCLLSMLRSSGQDAVNASCPYLWRTLLGSRFDWNFTSTPQKALNGRTIGYSAGHVLGGSSLISEISLFLCLNWHKTFQMLDYTRGSADDYDRWARVAGDSGWSWSKLLPYFKKVRLIHTRQIEWLIDIRSKEWTFRSSGLTCSQYEGPVRSIRPRLWGKHLCQSVRSISVNRL